MAAGKRSDLVSIRRQQQKIAADIARREQIRAQGDLATPKPKPSPPAGRRLKLPKSRRRRPSQGIVTGFKKGSPYA